MPLLAQRALAHGKVEMMDIDRAVTDIRQHVDVVERGMAVFDMITMIDKMNIGRLEPGHVDGRGGQCGATRCMRLFLRRLLRGGGMLARRRAKEPAQIRQVHMA
ncbi:hypothetical protein RAA17_04825 [Komagataeibacter rhaeticus]|nr:hypothetical protein [Komagataeibacter rhaeticus]